MAEQVDMSLDDIIKQNRKRPQRRGFQQYRSRLIRGRSTATKARLQATNRQQVSRSNRWTTTVTRGGVRKTARRGGPPSQQKPVKQTTYTAVQGRQQQIRQKQRRQYTISQRRGQNSSTVNNRKQPSRKYGTLASSQKINTNINMTKRTKLNRNFSVGGLVSDHIITEQKKQRRWKTQLQRSDSVLSVTVPNISSTEVKVLFKKRKARPQINRQNLSGSSPVIIVTSPTSNDNQVEIVTSPKPTRRRRQNKPQKLIDNFTVEPNDDDDDVEQEQKINPTTQPMYEFKRTDFAKAATGITLDERFSRMVKYMPDEHHGNTGGRQVFL